MKLLEALRNVDKSNPIYVDYETLADALDVRASWDLDLDERLLGYELTSWRCTDQNVGIRAIYLDDELIGMSNQTSRKATTEYQFVSQEIVEKVRLLISEKPTEVSLIQDKEFDSFFTVEYGNQLLKTDYDGFYENRKVTVTKIWSSYSDISKWHQVRVTDGSSEFEIPLSSFKIPVRLVNQEHVV